MRIHQTGFVLTLACTLLLLPGCENPAQEPPTTPAAGEPSEAIDEVTVEDLSKDVNTPATEEPTANNYEDAFASLSPEEQQSVTAQQICPVSGEPLGSMGTPKKVEVKDQTVWICCDGCRDKLKAEPDKYLAKLGQRTDD